MDNDIMRKFSCENKMYHDTWNEADNAISNMKKQGEWYGQAVYSCKFCNGYHVGRPSRNERKSAEEYRQKKRDSLEDIGEIN